MKTLTPVAFGLLITSGQATAVDPVDPLTTHNSSANKSQYSKQNTTGQKHHFFSLLRATRLDYRLLSTAETIKTSDVIVRGRIVAISAGRSLYPTNGYSNSMDTVLIKMSVSKSFKGSYETRDFVYFEYLLSAYPIDYLNKNKYKGEILVLLRTPTWNSAAYTIIDSDQGLMHEVDTLYKLTIQQALLIEKPDDSEGTIRISQPLNEGRPLFLGQSLKQVEEEIAALLTGDALHH